MKQLCLTTAALLVMALAGCDHGSSLSGGASTPPVDLGMRVTDVTHTPISGAVVTIASGNALFESITNAEGRASLAGAPSGDVTVSVEAAGFETLTFATRFPEGARSVSLHAEGEWAIARPISLGARMLGRASDGSTLTFSVDVAVVGPSSAAIENLTSAHFEVLEIDCGWSGPRDCASDASGKASADGGRFGPDGGALSFGLQPPSTRRPYVVGVLAERSRAMGGAEWRAAGLKAFFGALGGNDQASLAAVESIGGTPTLTALGPFTSDGRTYFDAIDGLAGSEAEPPVILSSLSESIRRAAAARDSAPTPVDATVLVIATESLTVAESDAITALARQLGVRVSAVVSYNWGLPEAAVRTGGFVAEFGDSRQLGPIFGAMDSLLAGTLPYYRLEFRIKGKPGVFVAGGNAKVRLRVRVPTPLPSHGTVIAFDVPIDS